MTELEFLNKAPLGRKMTFHGVRGDFTGVLVHEAFDEFGDRIGAFLLDEENRLLHFVGIEDVVGITYHDVSDEWVHMFMSNLEDGANQVE